MDARECELLLVAAKTGTEQAIDRLLADASDSLQSVAGHRLGNRIQARVDASDVVQQSLLDIYLSIDQFRGHTAAEWRAWTHSILCNNISNEIDRHLLARKRSVKRARSIHLDRFGAGCGESLPAVRQRSPGRQLVEDERHSRLHAAITHLPDAQQDAIRLRYMQNKSVAEIAGRLNRSQTAVAGLLKRGLRSLRGQVRLRSAVH